MYRRLRMLELEDLLKNKKSSSGQVSSSQTSVSQTSSSQASVSETSSSQVSVSQTSSSQPFSSQASSSQASGSYGINSNIYYNQASTRCKNSSSILGLDKHDCIYPLLKQKASCSRFHSSTAKHDNTEGNVLKAYKKLRFQVLNKLKEESTSDESSDTSLEMEIDTLEDSRNLCSTSKY